MSLPEHFVELFDTTVKNAYQSEGILTPDMFYTKTGNVRTFYFNKQGIMHSNKHVPNQYIQLEDIDRSRVSVDVDFYDIASSVDPTEQDQLNYSAFSEIAASARHAAYRRRDAVILDAITSQTYTNQIPKNVSGSDKGLTLEALRVLAAEMDENNVPKEGRTIILPTAQIHKLLEDDKVTSVDFNTVQTLVKGEIKSFYGFDFIGIPTFQVKKGVEAGLLPDGTDIHGYAFVKAAKGDPQRCPIGIGMNVSLRTSVDKNILLSNSTIILLQLGLCAKVIDEKEMWRLTFHNA